jgi:hypothetical protein
MVYSHQCLPSFYMVLLIDSVIVFMNAARTSFTQAQNVQSGS